MGRLASGPPAAAAFPPARSLRAPSACCPCQRPAALPLALPHPSQACWAAPWGLVGQCPQKPAPRRNARERAARWQEERLRAGTLTVYPQSTVCEKIMELLGQNEVDHRQRKLVILSQDRFYKVLTAEQKAKALKGQYNFDHPGAGGDPEGGRGRTGQGVWGPGLAGDAETRVAPGKGPGPLRPEQPRSTSRLPQLEPVRKPSLRRGPSALPPPWPRSSPRTLLRFWVLCAQRFAFPHLPWGQSPGARPGSRG